MPTSDFGNLLHVEKEFYYFVGVGVCVCVGGGYRQ